MQYPSNQPTVPHQPVSEQATVVTQKPTHKKPSYESGPPKSHQKRPKDSSKKQSRWGVLLLIGIPVIGVLALVGALILGLLVVYGSGNILPGVSAAGVELGGESESAAANALASSWQNEGIVLVAGTNRYQINPVELGLNIDAAATAAAAQDWGRGEGGILGGVESILTGVDVEPRLNVDLAQTRTKLEEIRALVEQPAVNAGVRLVNGQAQAVPAIQGSVLDIEATLQYIQADAAGVLADGELELITIPVAPAVTDASSLVQQASALLNSPLDIDVYDPVENTSQVWSVPPQQWSQWLVASPNANSLSLSLDNTALSNYLSERSGELGSPRYIDVDESVQWINDALASNQTSAWIRVYHQPTTYTVQAGENFSTIGYDSGIPYPWIQTANPSITSLSPGQQITLPSKDDLLPLPIVRNKRIVVSISEQRMWAYENGELVYDWRVSTGIARSPTSPGIFQIQSHDPNAYAEQWNLYMPHFMGVYEPGPNAGVMNGFHGFPTSATGGYLLWTDDLGRPATYGCILLSLENAEILYSWATEGVVVEITR